MVGGIMLMPSAHIEIACFAVRLRTTALWDSS
jgi:hypothetical protein